VTWLDVVLLALFVLSLLAGYRRGAVLQLTGLVGLIGGAIVGALIAPPIARLTADRTLRAVVALGILVVMAAAGNLGGTVVGNRIKRRVGGGFGRADAIGGAAVSGVALFLATWFIALNLANGPFPQLSRGIGDSRVVQAIGRIMPQPPRLIGELRSVLNTLGFPDVFVGLPPIPASPVAPPTDEEETQAQRAAAGSTVEVLGDGCYSGYYDQGSGFVVAPRYVITNAHVLGGTTRQWIHQDGSDDTATVVAFDPALDVAVLYVPDLPDPALPLEPREVDRGAVGAVLGYPGGGLLTGVKAAVRQVIDPTGRDIYGRGHVTRRMYEIQAEIRQGNSGGPFVLTDGRVAGLVFAASVTNDHVGYALVIGRLEPTIDAAVGRTAPVSTQSCGT
jgi:hypothetical protein